MLALPMLLSTNIGYCIAKIYFSILLYFCILSTNRFYCCAHRHIICLWLRRSLFFYSACDFILMLFLHFPIFCHDTQPVLLLSLSSCFIFFLVTTWGHHLVYYVYQLTSHVHCTYLQLVIHYVVSTIYLMCCLSGYPPSKFQQCCMVLMCNLTKGMVSF